MFRKILIANRGEIACRIIRTARRMGVATVAVHSDADAGARHVLMADEAIGIGSAPARESYLRGEAIVAAAKRAGAEAVHPGYGFLSEHVGFAAGCAAAGLVFIGPRPAAIRAMGDKSAARALMAAAGVPVVPGYHGADQADARLAEEARRIGYPVMIKAAAGGGGKGMRAVGAPGEFAACLASARREAQAAFGDERVLIEKYLTAPRHIEVQVFADGHGQVVHLFERDCSVQRRHQKIIEEAPAPGVTSARRGELCAAAVTAARAVDYLSAGTVEFIADAAGRFYFMEMNTRLQVEHPVTELITGQDLVEWQLRVAAGEPLPARQEDLCITGHAIEARLYAEDPNRDFLPATGRLSELGFPADSRHLRVDSGFQAGDVISIHYDPLIAKLVAWDVDRPNALCRLRTLLRGTRLAGMRTNLEFLAAVAGHEAFARGAVDTGFIDRHRDELLDRGQAAKVPDLFSLKNSSGTFNPSSPWLSSSGWRFGSRADAAPRAGSGRGLQEKPQPDPARGGPLVAPMPGRVVSVHVAQGQAVRRGEPLVVLAAMKMEHTVAAPTDGVVGEVRFAAGDLVEEGAELLVLESVNRG